MMALLKGTLLLSIVCVHFSPTFSKSQLIKLGEDNWQDMLTGEWMVEFYAPWCPACKALQPLWDEFSSWSKDLGVSVAQVDITQSPGLSGRFMVTALPTIFHVINGEFRQYKGARDRDSFMSFVEEKKWKNVETVSSWKHPASVQMSVVSYFFVLSQGLRTIHNELMVSYGLPYWGSYLIFAFVTILIGATLGLVLVCFIDFIYPPKAMQHSKKENEKSKDGVSEASDDDIPDDLVDDQQTQQESNNARKRKARKAD